MNSLHSPTAEAEITAILFGNCNHQEPEPQVVACSPMETGALNSKKKFVQFSLNRKSKYDKECGTFSRSHRCINKGHTRPLFSSITDIEK